MYVIIKDNKPLSMQQCLPPFGFNGLTNLCKDVKTPEYQMIPLLATQAEAQDMVKRCNKYYGAGTVSYKKVRLEDDQAAS